MENRTIRSADTVLDTFSQCDLVPHVYIDTNLSSESLGDNGSTHDLLSPEYMQRLFEASGDLLAQLDHGSQELTKRLETLAAKLATSGRRLTYDISLLKSELASLQNAIDDDMQPRIHQLVAEVSQDKVIDKLTDLDQVKRGLEQVIILFDEADMFDESGVTKDVNVLIERGDYKGALAKLDRVDEVCKIWQGTNVFPRRVQFLADLRNRLVEAQAKANPTKATVETVLPTSSPANLADKDKTDDEKQTKDSYYSIFGQLGRKIGY
ncbi:hypothetical protein NADFUDRAFT_64294 [Nadsonia fulvescens var. elongata DSM 6958]|uniref:Uncharacterized protein n=1 Tax=Nadsonia fulvescens var. elongata DSM 6958 TaxID=857566 RepID=A0A1E3PNV9_9ASCO|nr:hypothetical protein NADFUDRAFT_64294 [Nadsonia fulvescens var. elongata DSM 6958]